jgi:flagellar biosynthetic protein FlhB
VDQERTQEATPRYKAKVRAFGQGPRSQFAAPACSVLLGGALVCALSRRAEALGEGFVAAARCASDGKTADAGYLLSCAHDVASLAGMAPALWLCWAAAAGGALLAAAASGSLTFAPLALVPKFARLGLGAGLRRLVNLENAWHGGIAVLLIALLLGSALAVSVSAIGELGRSATLALQLQAVRSWFASIWQRAAAWMAIFAVVDGLWARARFASSLRMTPRQLRDERAQTEARPETRQRQKAVGARRARSLRIEAIRQATAVVTNPAHVAVALRYAPPAIDVPIVVARGADLTAAIVRAVARQADVPLIASQELARTLYARVEVDEPIPEDCYAAVAAIFAWIVRTRGVLRGGQDDSA